MPVQLQPTSGYGNTLDLATSTFVSNVLAAGGITPNSAQSVILPSLITAASREIVKWCRRRFDLAVYDEIFVADWVENKPYDPAWYTLKIHPIQDVTRVANGRATVLSIQNTDQTTNQRATVALAVSGDVEWPDLVYTGLNLSRTASGVTTPTSVDFATYTTVQAVADHINTLGNGWTATINSLGPNQPNYALLPSTELIGEREPKNALTAPANLDIFGAVPNSYNINRSSGIFTCRHWLGFAWLGGTWGGWGGDIPYGFGAWGWQQYRVTYTSGYSTIPEPLQLVCAEVVKLMLARLLSDPALKSENTGKYSYVAAESLANLPPDKLATLALYRDNRI